MRVAELDAGQGGVLFFRIQFHPKDRTAGHKVLTAAFSRPTLYGEIYPRWGSDRTTHSISSRLDFCHERSLFASPSPVGAGSRSPPGRFFRRRRRWTDGVDPRGA